MNVNVAGAKGLIAACTADKARACDRQARLIHRAWWALSAGGVKAGFVRRHTLRFTKDSYHERNGLGGSFHLTALAFGTLSLAKRQVRRLISDREVGR